MQKKYKGNILTNIPKHNHTEPALKINKDGSDYYLRIQIEQVIKD